ncbi:hypothetical protein MKU65_03495 [Leptospira interrogans]|uniref:3-isopropylmalate dehydratase n=2 Tax=Leptospira interrogans TaxID=173 RepID=M6GFY0_LEPIR|nr:hypothetical protein [Leptospira interrogans]EJP15484.1 hypothetical protein LEP1GSC080_3445 [Leptospira interrogans str. FPW2026]EKO98418.1 hypothetical protein LEP1GSC057_3915 [Leptospira interrogans str. Brem 329]EMM81419.1 hypothetical protein LEP1GSC037_5642 [Leptospira interrogans str. 2006001854]ALE38071.1 3-isopropylmalate dehydratase small subunit [Leptospira interrogans serovar Hardjo str. Norma]ALO01502.1 3-isopropylmalate dehydratase small subunit [Leptospira interrogans serovar
MVAPSFADIFFGNCAKNGIVLVRLSFEEVEEIIQYVSENTGAEISVDLGMLILGLGNKKYNFNLLESFANRIRNGWDDIDLTRKHIQKIELFESALQ